MEAGYNSHTDCHRAAESQFGGDGIFGESGPFIVSPSSYYYNSPPPGCVVRIGARVTGAIRSQGQQQHQQRLPEVNGEESLARKLTVLTGSLIQGKPIRVDDLMSLKLDHDVRTFFCFFFAIFFFDLMFFYFLNYAQSDPKAIQLLENLHSELRLAANSRQSGQLDPHLPVVNPPPTGQKIFLLSGCFFFSWIFRTRLL